MIAELYNQLLALRTDFTSVKAGYLDAAISSRAPAATALSSAVWTPTKAGYIDAPISGLANAPPIAGGIKGISDTAVHQDELELNSLDKVSVSQTTYNLWTTLLEETSAKGILEFLSVFQVSNLSSVNGQFRFSIDGNVMYTSPTTFWSGTGFNEYGAGIVGMITRAGTTLGSASFSRIPFNASFKLEFIKTENVAGTLEIGCRYRYHLIG